MNAACEGADLQFPTAGPCVSSRNKKEKLTALLHHITVDVLRRVFFKLKKRAAPGVDGVTWEG